MMGLFQWAVLFLIASLGAGTLGFTGIGQGTAVIARGVFGVFLAISLVLLALVVILGENIALN